jgi:hypothetical protein
MGSFRYTAPLDTSTGDGNLLEAIGAMKPLVSSLLVEKVERIAELL